MGNVREKVHRSGRGDKVQNYAQNIHGSAEKQKKLL